MDGICSWGPQLSVGVWTRCVGPTELEIRLNWLGIVNWNGWSNGVCTRDCVWGAERSFFVFFFFADLCKCEGVCVRLCVCVSGFVDMFWPCELCKFTIEKPYWWSNVASSISEHNRYTEHGRDLLVRALAVRRYLNQVCGTHRTRDNYDFFFFFGPS